MLQACVFGSGRSLTLFAALTHLLTSLILPFRAEFSITESMDSARFQIVHLKLIQNDLVYYAATFAAMLAVNVADG